MTKTGIPVWVRCSAATLASVFVTLCPNLGVCASEQGISLAASSPPIAGTFDGLLYQRSGVYQSTVGSFVLQTTTKGSYSGRIQLGKSRLAFKGRFEAGPMQATNQIGQKHSAPLWIEFSIIGDSAERVLGRVSDGASEAFIVANRSLDAKTKSSLAGTYTLAIPGELGTANSPVGHSYATVRIAPNGSAKLAGALADGTRFSQGARLSVSGMWPLYAGLYSGQGSVSSWLVLSNRPYDDIHGTVHWARTSGTGDRPGEFAATLRATGSAFKRGTAPMAGATAQVAFEGGNLAHSFTNSLAVNGTKFVNQGQNKLALKVSPSTGLFLGKVTDPTSGTSYPFSGALVQKQNVGYGFLRGADQASQVTLMNNPPTGAKIYFAPRTDGRFGTGTEADPYDVSTPEKLSTMWFAVVWSPTNRSGMHLVFKPGTYYANNHLMLAHRQHDIVLSGYGAKIFVQKTFDTHSQFTVIIANYEVDSVNDNVVLEGFEIDCGTMVTDLGMSAKVSGVLLNGTGNLVRDVTIRNVYSTDDLMESFGIVCWLTNSTVTGCKVIGHMDLGKPSLATAICINGDGNTVTRNEVDMQDDLYHPDPSRRTSFAFSGYCCNSTFSDNTTRHCDVGYAADGGRKVTNEDYPFGTVWRNNVFSGNYLFGNRTGLRIENNYQQYLDWTFTGNVFQTTNYWIYMYMYPEVINPNWSNKVSGFKFIGNHFAGQPVQWNLRVNNYTNHYFIRNTFDSIPSTVAKPWHVYATNTFVFGAGNVVMGVPDDSAFTNSADSATWVLDALSGAFLPP